MHILLANDDGIDAPGIIALHRELTRLGDVSVVAPSDVQSAMSHSVTFHRAVATRRTDVAPFDLDESDADANPANPANPAYTGIAVDGRPADCVRLAIRHILDRPVDLVVSGMNAGANVGTHVIYSGTVAAAVEGAFDGLPAAAVSLHIGDWNRIQWRKAARLAVDTLEAQLARGIDPGTVANINIPVLDQGDPLGTRIVPVSPAPSRDFYDEQAGDNGDRVFTIRQSMAFPDRPDDTDVACLYQRYITVSPLHFDRTDHNRLHAWQQAIQHSDG